MAVCARDPAASWAVDHLADIGRPAAARAAAQAVASINEIAFVGQGARRYVLKRGRNARARRDVATEARMLAAVATRSDLRPARRYAPAFVHYDSASGILVTRAFGGSARLAACWGEKEALRIAVPSAGRALARVHAALLSARARGAIDPVPSKEPTIWYAPEMFRAQAAAGDPRSVIFSPILDEHVSSFWEASRRDAAAAWHDTAEVVHGDASWDNFLFHHSTPRTRLVDWECVSRGDPAWDVARFLVEPLRCEAAHPLLDARCWQPLLRRFLSEYSRTNARHDMRDKATFRRVVLYLPFTLALAATMAPDIPRARALLAEAARSAQGGEAWARERLLGEAAP